MQTQSFLGRHVLILPFGDVYKFVLPMRKEVFKEL
jgi:hypothetical protein